jgi:hypothetical protein
MRCDSTFYQFCPEVPYFLISSHGCEETGISREVIPQFGVFKSAGFQKVVTSLIRNVCVTTDATIM